jgi:hypothetical protein
MSNFSRTKLFWQGTKGSNAAMVAEKQSQERLQARIGIARIEAWYQELKQNAERRGDPPGAEAQLQDAAEGRALQAT